MTKRSHFNFVIIGGGPAGQKAAVQAAKDGKSVAMIEKDRQIGGACVHRGTIPSKTLRESVLQITQTRQCAQELGIDIKMDSQMSILLSRLQSVVNAHSNYMQHQIDRNGISYIHGQASFLSDDEIEVTHPNGKKEIVLADNFIVATGSRPRIPDDVPIDHEHIYDSDSILSMFYIPKSMVVLGAGVIASEYASILAVLGCEVTMVDRGDRPLQFMEPELTDHFLQTLDRFGGRYIGGVTADSLTWDGISKVHCKLSSGEEIITEKALFALGRVANIERLGIQNTAVKTTPRGLIEVDDFYCTASKNIYAVGDIIGPPALASTSMEQGRQAVCNALGKSKGHLIKTIPVGIYTIPEMASVGLAEAAAIEKYGAATTGTSRFEEIARGQISGIQDGLLKIVSDDKGEKILGVHIVGEGAAELIHIGQIAMLKNMTIDEIIENIFNFPTLAEAYRVAALDIRGRLSGKRKTTEKETEMPETGEPVTV